MIEGFLDDAPSTGWKVLRDAQEDQAKAPLATRWIAETYGPRIRRYVLWKLRGDADAADDVLQEVFVAVCAPEFLTGLDPTLSLRKLLKVIAFRRVKDLERRRARAPAGCAARGDAPLEEMLPAAALDDGAEFDRAWVESVIAEALRALGPGDRELWKVVAGGGDNEEIADCLSITRGAADKRAHDARERLRRTVRAIVSRDFVRPPAAAEVEVELDELALDRILDALARRRERR